MEKLEALLRLTHIPGLGSTRIRKLIELHGSPVEAWQAPEINLPGLSSTVREAWEVRTTFTSWQTDWKLAEQSGTHLVPYYEATYPKRLLNIIDPPILLYVQGRLDFLDHDAVAIIGTRQSTLYGMAMAENFSEQLAAAGICIVSGLARGVDTAAHKAALHRGKTVAVLGSGLAHVYPPENEMLANNIVAKGALISELPMHTPPDRLRFPQRNRIVSGLARAVVLVEAPIKSGAMITMQQAQSQGRTCWAMPGRLDYPSFAGNHHLLSTGQAQIACSPQDILATLGDFFGPLPSTKGNLASVKIDLSSDEETLFTALPADELNIDDICALIKKPIAHTAGVLISLTLKNLIKEYPGKRFKKVSPISHG